MRNYVGRCLTCARVKLPGSTVDVHLACLFSMAINETLAAPQGLGLSGPRFSGSIYESLDWLQFCGHEVGFEDSYDVFARPKIRTMRCWGAVKLPPVGQANECSCRVRRTRSSSGMERIAMLTSLKSLVPNVHGQIYSARCCHC
jgi:hypothetical protein